VKKLTAAVHEALPGIGQVIWYDAVTVRGELQWQCRLNENNHDFFVISGSAE
jgi:mannosyl-glycoprotein endo-beta-N-acetylglucosaminidase